MASADKNTSLQKTFLCLFVLLICCSVAYWPLIFHVFSLKNDALNYFLPVRHQVSEAISYGYWPFWSPYFNLGYPLHGDMQSGVWNPFVQIFSLFGPYTLKTLQCETILYVYLSGIGMFFLIQYFFKDWRICLVIATGYMLCGFNLDSGQYLNWISGASFLPFVFLFYYRTITELNWKTALCCSIFLFLFFTTAYPADFILVSYLLLSLTLWHFFPKENRTKKFIGTLFKLHVFIFIGFVLLCLPAIISYKEFLPLSDRGTGTTFEAAMSNPLNPLLLFTYVTPLPAMKLNLPESFYTDPLERNSFFGLIPFAFLLLSYFIKSNHRIIRFCKWGFVLSLVFSFGEYFGLRPLTYYVLPLMNTFRHPANERLFSIFFACLLAAYAMKEFLNSNKKFATKYVMAILILVLVLLTIWATKNLTFAPSLQALKNSIASKTLLEQLNFYDLLLIDIILQLPFLILLFLFFNQKLRLRWLIVATLLNCVLQGALLQPFTVVKKDSVAAIQSVLNSIEQSGYPIPNIQNSLEQNSSSSDLFKEIGVTNLYNKKVGRVEYKITPCNLLNQISFWSNQKIRNILFQYPLVYKADTIIKIADAQTSVTNKKMIFIYDGRKDYAIKNDTATSNITIKKFVPNSFEMQIESDQSGFYCLFQNYYPRWNLFVDGKKQNIISCNIAFMGFELPAGKHFVSFEYKSTDLKVSYLISVVGLLTMLVLIFWKKNVVPKKEVYKSSTA